MSDALYVQILVVKSYPAIIHWIKCSEYFVGVISRFFPEKLHVDYVIIDMLYVIIDSPCLEEYSWSPFYLPFYIIQNGFFDT